jgi:glycosyltransferase involved in cell wall biosynthesis
MLTVAIPTFNRNEQIFDLLRILLPQINQYSNICQLLIIDNCSSQPVQESLNQLISQFPDISIKIHRNQVNVGLSANLLRCFEFCETEWMWLLGDDDLVYDRACECILEKMRRNSSSHFIHFASNLGKRTSEFTALGLDELLEKIDSYDNLGFLSVGVYKVSFFKPYIPVAYSYDYTLFPHIVLLFMAFEKDNLEAVFSNQEIVQHIRPPEGKAWSKLELYHRLLIILEVPSLSHSNRILLYKKIMMNRRLEEYITTRYLLQAIQEGSSKNAIYKFDHSMFRLFYFEKNVFRKFKVFIYRLLFINPALWVKLINLILGSFNKPTLKISDYPTLLRRI